MRYFIALVAALLLTQSPPASPSHAAEPVRNDVNISDPNTVDERSLPGEFVNVPGGCFQMGDTFGDGKDNERPVHEVCVSDFSISKYEVTQGQWKRVMGSNPSYYDTCGDNCPVEQVSWKDIRQFIQQLNSLTGSSFRLPTEAEWEYAARSGGKREKYSGSDNAGDVAWFESNSGKKTHPVGQKQPNGLGIYDMSGNVWECVSDWYDKNYYATSPKNDPHGASSGSSHVIRGGNWFSGAPEARVTDRRGVSPVYRRSILGFRLALSAHTGNKTTVPVKDEANYPPVSAVDVRTPEGELVTVPGGCFTANGRQVCLDSFRIGKHEVTQGQYKRVMGNNPSEFDECGEDCPVEKVSWDDAQSFIAKLNNLTGKSYRLPTEAEWEYACRSSGKTEKFCGSDNVDEVAWYDKNSGEATHPVATKKPNGLGIYDMSGNVDEWVSDWYGDKYPSSDKNPPGPPAGDGRVIRGGGHNRPADCSRAAGGNNFPPGRDPFPPEIGTSSIGFRLAAPLQ